MSSPRVVVIGAGFGGLGVARALRDTGVDDVTILERADDVGGVWRDNTYPGAACDVPTPLYSWSWAPNPEWGRRYGPQAEILAYLRRAAGEAGLLDLVRTGVEVKAAEYDETRGRWRVTTGDGETLEADVVISAVGQLSNPAVPAIPGADTFAGPAFHSAQWRHDVDLAGKRVAVVGTGASAIQFVPGIVDEVASMTVLQRSAPYVVPKPDQAYGPRHHALFRRLPRTQLAERRTVFWLTEKLNAALGGDSRLSRPLLAAVRGAFRLQLRRQVRDPSLRRKLVPDYPIGCKRLLFSNDWYPALDRDHVDVVTDRVTSIEPSGLRTADGRLHEADVIIWGTGFAATQFLAGIEVRGADGADLHEVWADGARAPQPVLRLRPQHQPQRQLDHRDDGGPGRLDRPGRAPDRRRPRPARRGAPGRCRGLRPRDAGPAVPQRLGGLQQLVPRRGADHHQLARPRAGVPRPHRHRGLGRAGGGRLAVVGLGERLVEVLEQVRGVVVHRDRAGVEQLLAAVAAREQPDRGQPGPVGRLDVPDGVPDHHRRGAGHLVERLGDQLRVGLGLVGVLAGGPGVGVLVGVQQLEGVAGVLGDAGAG